MSRIHLVTAGTREIIRIGQIQVRVMEDGSRTDHRIGAVEVTVPPGLPGPPQHIHKMHDETFLVTAGIVQFTVGDATYDARAGDYVVVPTGEPHTFSNSSDGPAVFFNTFTPAWYVNYFRDLAKLAAAEGISPEGILRVMACYATMPA